MSAHPSPFASADYQRYLEEGGKFEAIVSAADLNFDADFERRMGAETLANGFPLPPTPIAFDDANYGVMAQHGDPVTRAIGHTGRNGGTVTYYRLTDGSYRVVFEYSKPAKKEPEESADK